MKISNQLIQSKTLTDLRSKLAEFIEEKSRYVLVLDVDYHVFHNEDGTVYMAQVHFVAKK